MFAKNTYQPLDISTADASDQESGQPTIVAPATSTNNWSGIWKRHKYLITCWSLAGAAVLLLLVLVLATTSRSSHGEELLGASAKGMLHRVVHRIPQLEEDFRGKPRQLSSKHGIVAADNSRCSDIGSAVLKDGGNAVDAAVATALCLGVVNPISSGIGGGAFITIYLPNGTAEVINAREPAPAAANTTMYSGKGKYASLDGGLAVAVPVELKGLHLAWQRYGVLPWRRLVLPAEVLARHGFAAHPYLIWVTSGEFTQARIKKTPLLREAFMVPDRSAAGGWRSPRVGEHCCRRPRLARTLAHIAEHGADWLYSGKVVEELAAEIQHAGGVVTVEDLKEAQPRVESPVRAKLADGFELITPKPPSSAAAVATALKIMQGVNISATDANYPHYMVESMKHAFALRMALGDPGSAEQPQWNVAPVMADMLDDAFVASLRAMLDPDHTLNQSRYGGKWNPDLNHTLNDHGTSHLSVVDALGTAVSITTSINTVFGSAVVSPSTGIILNNQMDDFSRPDIPNTYKLHPAEANFIQPGKRPLSSMSPSIVVKGGRVRMVAGASGGPLIVTATYQSILRVLLQKKTVWQAVTEPRMHHQLWPNEIFYENYTFGNITFSMPAKELQLLTSKGHVVREEHLPLGVSQVIVVDRDGLATGVSDPRKDGAPSAFA